MQSLTVSEAIDVFSVDIDPHLARDVEIPVITGRPQRQGDVIVLPRPRLAEATAPVPSGGTAVVRGENGGNTHAVLSLPGQDVRVDIRMADAQNLTLGVMTVASDAVAYLAHPEHGYMGFGPGTYEIRRQREQADELRMVAD